MPETVLQIPIDIQGMPEVFEKDYDLVILGIQPWFLSPSQPVNSFLKSKWSQVLKNKPVITVIACRNMWLNAIEKVKGELNKLNAKHVGHIVLEDKHSNITSTLTVIRWMFKGQKEKSKRLPEAGVSKDHILASRRFTLPIQEAVIENNYDHLQEKLLFQNAVSLHPNLIVLEKRGLSQFPKWAKRIRSKGKPGDLKRKPLVTKFKNLLIIAIFVLSPISSLIGKIQALIQRKQLKKDVAYFKSVNYIIRKLKP